MKGDDAKTRRILNEDKGLTDETLTAFGVTIKPDGKVVLPYEGRLRERIDLPRPDPVKPDRRFVWGESDAPIMPYNVDDAGKRTVFICEGETDTMRLWQEMPAKRRETTGVVGMPGVNAWKDAWAPRFEDAENIFVVMDNPTGYDDVDNPERTWRKIRAVLGTRCRRVYLREDVKDVVEFFNKYPWKAFVINVKETATGGKYHWTPLNLLSVPQPPDWLLWEAIARGEVNVLIGAPWGGKSFWYLGLVAAIMHNQTEYCGMRLNVPADARVIIYDEENPPRIPIWRMNKLGITSEQLGSGRIRYINRCHVRLDTEADKVIDECMAFEPTLAIFDSYDRFHQLQDPYKTSAVSAIFTECLAPIADITGCACLLLHHEPKPPIPKDDKPVAFKSFAQRSRGSMAIAENADQGLILEVDEDKRTRHLLVGGTRGSAVDEGTKLASFLIQDQPAMMGGEKSIGIVPTFSRSKRSAPINRHHDEDDDDTF